MNVQVIISAPGDVDAPNDDVDPLWYHSGNKVAAWFTADHEARKFIRRNRKAAIELLVSRGIELEDADILVSIVRCE